MNISYREELLPLTPQTLHILLALAVRPRHGYDIAYWVEQDTGGMIKLATGTVYGALKRLTAQHLLERVETQEGSGPAGECYFYGLTADGRWVLEGELQRYQSAVNLGKERLNHGAH
ncbi:MAG TPA: helix-turn-helix transcriptional regulator [Candidatus Saccharimonadia bacterium]|nr:helix-turn-helix transcriptional regulator [Candidatus Saccharimonadia bacterium]